jgi:hypothetical protein
MIALLEGLKIISKTQPNAKVMAMDGAVFCGNVSDTDPKDKQLLDALDWSEESGIWRLEVDAHPKWYERGM